MMLNQGRHMKALTKAAGIVGLALAAAQAGLGAQDSLTAAKDQYASAAYEDALSTLTRLTGSGGAAPDIARQVDEYRAFCLYALGRTGEAESVAESIIRKEPMTKLDTADASPRLEMMFSNVRKRLLPSLIRERFRTARTALDEKNPSAAEPQLVEARLMIADAEKLGVKDDGLADLSVLVDGFLQLVRSTADQRTSPQPGAAIPPDAPPATAVSSQRIEPLPAPGTTVAARVYTVDDVGVTPPAVISQRMPAMTIDLVRITKAMNASAILDVVIDERGDVLEATIRKSVNTSFDNLIVGAARRWKYRPAVKDGVPVRYIKTLVLVP
jgi:TonB-like protein